MKGFPSQLNSEVNFNEETKTAEGQRLRVFQRADITGEVLVHDDKHLYIAPLGNISAAGVFVADLVALEEGCIVRVVVKSKRLTEPVQATGKVVRIGEGDDKGIAIEFTSISSRGREVIQNCVFEARMERALKVA